ncbi:MAG TPA: hypothetical protein PKI53_08055 [Candidatus Aminicenantes bacterium]|nr:hypothetical protein [Acidobacteriota bacterium]HNQ81037.1 hypothetical protein [Candidatus Aminicenantes bacterium]
MKIRKWAVLYSLIVGVSMIGMWTMFFASGGIPELKTKPLEINLHLAAELSTAVLLLIGGWGLIKRRPWGTQAHSLSMGMLLYTLIASPGYYLQKGELPFVFIGLSFFKKEDFLSEPRRRD